MTRSIAYLSLALSLALGTAAAQAVVESGLGAARAVTSTAPANGLGKSMGGLAGSLVVDLEVLVGAVAEQLGAAGTKVGEPGDELLRRRSGRRCYATGVYSCTFTGWPSKTSI